jgi:beta-N-acetylhexosaminidase
LKTKLLCLILSIALLFSVSAFAEGNGDDTLEIMFSTMTLREKVAQMMIASFRIWQEVPETEDGEQPVEESSKTNIVELNDEIREMIARDHFGGILLFGENFTDPEQTLRLVSDLQATNRNGGGIPQLIFVDQEGGSVNRIPYSTIGVSNMALGATGDPENARQMAAIHGEEIRLLGIHTDFAPVMDVNNDASNPVIGIRSFSDDPQTVAQFGCAYLSGLHDTGIIAALKHFPGHGNTATDSHTGFPLINSTYEELKECELVPFQAAIDAGADMVMTAHIQYPQIEQETYTSVSTGEQVYLPATMSHTILTDILRGDMGFDGLIVTDALDMKAITDNFSVEDTIKLAINAGADLLILPAVKDTNLFKLTETYVDTAVALVESGEIDEARINESVLRILKLKARYGVLDQTDFTVTDEQIAAAKDGVGSAEHRETERQIVENALTLVKNDNGAFPLQVKPGEKTLILFADSCASRAGTGDLVRLLLEEQQALPDGAEIVVMKNTKDNVDVCVLAALGADHVILVHRLYAQACLDPSTEDGFSSGAFDKIIDALHEKGKTAIVVSCQLPYDAARFPEADAILLTYWGSIMRELPAEGSSWSANLPAGLLACFGAAEANGRLPVNIPALDETYQPANRILWIRGQPAAERN